MDSLPKQTPLLTSQEVLGDTFLLDCKVLRAQHRIPFQRSQTQLSDDSEGELSLDGESDVVDTISNSLVAYRLGRLEKAIETTENNSVNRDEKIINTLTDSDSKILDKLTVIETISKDIAIHAMRLDRLEAWQATVNRFLTAVVLAIVGIVLQILFGR